jgi:formate hydrogenlyase subunit 3/multisubunit Na+/H+ antiporter MnhD subunit
VLAWFLLAPLAGVTLLNLPFADALRKRAFAVAILFALAQAAAVVLLPLHTWNGTFGPGHFLALNLQVDDLSRVMLLSVALAVFAAAFVGGATIVGERPRCNFANVLLIGMIGMNGAVMVTDLFSLYVFVEITSVCSFILIAFNHEPAGLEGAFKYIILSVAATVLMLASIALLLMVCGSSGYADITAGLTSKLKDPQSSMLARAAMAAFVCGLFIKGGLVPFHGWVLGADSAAPAAGSVLLAGVATKVAGVYALIRLAGFNMVFPASDPLNQALLLVGAVSIVVGALAALGQSDIKRMLAYSSIS